MMAVRQSLQTGCNTIPARWPCTWWALFGLLLSLFVVGSVPTVHGHDGPGLYDEECPFVWLAVAKPGVPFPSAPALARLMRAPDPVPVLLAARLVDVSLASFDPRAPPFPTLPAALAH